MNYCRLYGKHDYKNLFSIVSQTLTRRDPEPHSNVGDRWYRASWLQKICGVLLCSEANTDNKKTNNKYCWNLRMLDFRTILVAYTFCLSVGFFVFLPIFLGPEARASLQRSFTLSSRRTESLLGC